MIYQKNIKYVLIVVNKCIDFYNADNGHVLSLLRKCVAYVAEELLFIYLFQK